MSVGANYWDFANKTLVLLSLTSIVGGIIWFFADLNNRIKILENQLQLLTASSALHMPEEGQFQNPVFEACAKLAMQISPSGNIEDINKNDAIERALRGLGCHSIH